MQAREAAVDAPGLHRVAHAHGAALSLIEVQAFASGIAAAISSHYYQPAPRGKVSPSVLLAGIAYEHMLGSNEDLDTLEVEDCENLIFDAKFRDLCPNLHATPPDDETDEGQTRRVDILDDFIKAVYHADALARESNTRTFGSFTKSVGPKYAAIVTEPALQVFTAQPSHRGFKDRTDGRELCPHKLVQVYKANETLIEESAEYRHEFAPTVRHAHRLRAIYAVTNGAEYRNGMSRGKTNGYTWCASSLSSWPASQFKFGTKWRAEIGAFNLTALRRNIVELFRDCPGPWVIDTFAHWNSLIEAKAIKPKLAKKRKRAGAIARASGDPSETAALNLALQHAASPSPYMPPPPPPPPPLPLSECPERLPPTLNLRLNPNTLNFHRCSSTRVLLRKRNSLNAGAVANVSTGDGGGSTRPAEGDAEEDTDPGAKERRRKVRLAGQPNLVQRESSSRLEHRFDTLLISLRSSLSSCHLALASSLLALPDSDSDLSWVFELDLYRRLGMTYAAGRLWVAERSRSGSTPVPAKAPGQLLDVAWTGRRFRPAVLPGHYLYRHMSAARIVKAIMAAYKIAAAGQWSLAPDAPSDDRERLPVLVLESTHADVPNASFLKDHVYARELYDGHPGDLRRSSLMPAEDQETISASGSLATAGTDQRRDEQNLLEHVCTLVRSAMENPANVLIAMSALGALERVGHRGDIWAQLDERLVSSGTGHGARGVERALQIVIDRSNNSNPGSPSLELPVNRAPFRDGESVWIVAPRPNLPLDDELPPRICEVGTRKDIPSYSVYIRPGNGSFTEKMWLWLPEGVWREVKQSDRHPTLLDRELKVYWTSPRTVKVNWVLKSSSDSMKRRKRSKRTGA
ncbi:hypothetical protein PENSPDRAFT_662727 [Peniophora sp. CONT]|nr:hypothetical protein PENSPDRAFT_662727 [Peniophora sp. CONT]